MNKIKSFIILASAIIIAYAPISAYAGCVPASAKIRFSCGAGTGTTPANMTITYGATTKFTSSTFAYNKCTAPDGKVFGGYIISADDGSIPDVEIIGPLEDNNFTFYYTSDITITARWIPNVMDPDTFSAIIDSNKFYKTDYTMEDVDGNELTAGQSSNSVQGSFTVNYYGGLVTGRWKAVSDSPSLPNQTVGYIVSDGDQREPTRTSTRRCLYKLDTIDGTQSYWVYGSYISSGISSSNQCASGNILNSISSGTFLRSLFSSFLTE